MAAAFPLPSSPCVLRKRPFPGLIPAHLVLFYRGPDLRLAWFASLTFPADEGRCDVVVAANGADAGAVLYCRNTVATAAARGLVFHESPARGDRRTTELPPPLSAYPPLRPPGLPAGFPGGWVEGSQTRGNNADARRRNRALRGRNSQGVVVFDPADRLGDDQRVLNAFYFCNYLHDFFYLLGVDEAERNFQKVDRTGGGRGGDELAVGVFDVVRGFAKMEVELDGRSCRLSLGRGPSTDLGRHTALDADVVFHEYVHGVTARLVGGGQLWKPLFGPPQTRALDEGYCDYFALSIQAYNRLAAQGPSAEAPADGLDRIAFGAWTAGDDQHGLRPHAYGDAFPGSLATLGSPDFREAHEAGQVWCEALLRMNRRLGEALGDLRRGHEIGWQAVVDSLKLLSGGGAGIGFLAARDRILTAFDALRDASPLLASGGPLVDPARYPALRQAALRAFAELGMGPGAASEGATFAGIVADFGTG
jgi:extracellular elastinolytic metalloproteinase